MMFPAMTKLTDLGITFEDMQHTIAKNLKSIVSLSINEERLKYQLITVTDQSAFSLQHPRYDPYLPGTWQTGYRRPDADKSDCLLPTDAEKIKRTDTDQRRTGNCPPVSGNGETLP